MDKIITLYHGSENIVEVPAFGKGRVDNGYTCIPRNVSK